MFRNLLHSLPPCPYNPYPTPSVPVAHPPSSLHPTTLKILFWKGVTSGLDPTFLFGRRYDPHRGRRTGPRGPWIPVKVRPWQERTLKSCKRVNRVHYVFTTLIVDGSGQQQFSPPRKHTILHLWFNITSKLSVDFRDDVNLLILFWFWFT